jgi:hypothetical protein
MLVIWQAPTLTACNKKSSFEAIAVSSMAIADQHLFCGATLR